MLEFIKRLFHDLTQVHPLHTMLVHFPIALSGAAFLFILLALSKRGRGLEIVAFANLVLVPPAVLAAGAAGLRDNLVFWNGAAPNVVWKIGLASGLFLVSAGTAYARWRNPDLFTDRRTRLLYVLACGLCFALAIVLSFLGGVIIYGF